MINMTVFLGIFSIGIGIGLDLGALILVGIIMIIIGWINNEV